jgi:hypothetical protein
MTETTITENKFTASVEIKTRLIADQIVTALEGGVGYWLESFKPVKGQERATTVQPWYDDEKVWASDFLIEAKVIDEKKKYQFTPESINKGLKWMAANQGKRIQEILDESGDADTADVFLQACLFEDIVYG